MLSRKEHINNAAALLFRKKGYAATSMNDIAKLLGIKAASLYNHINSKQEILSNLLLPISNSFSKGMDDIKNSSLSSTEKLNAFVTLHVQITVQNTDRMALITGEWVHLESKNLKKYKKARDQYESYFMSILIDCKKEGYIAEKTNIELALFSILSTLHWLYSWLAKHPNISIVELENQLKICLLSGVRKN